MPQCECLIAAVNMLPYTKGDIAVVKDAPDDVTRVTWGTSEGLPDWVIVRITNASAEQVNRFLDQWIINLGGENLGVFSEKRRLRIYADPTAVGKVPDWHLFREEMRDYIEQEWDGELVPGTATQTEATYDFPLEMSIPAFKQDMVDKYEDVLKHRAYYVPEENVDAGIAAGGYIERTKQQADDLVVDRRL